MLIPVETFRPGCGFSLIRRIRLGPAAGLLLAALEVFPQRRAQTLLPSRAGFGLGALGHVPTLRHDPEKWVPVFRKDHAQESKIGADFTPTADETAARAGGAAARDRREGSKMNKVLMVFMVFIIIG